MFLSSNPVTGGLLPVPPDLNVNDEQILFLLMGAHFGCAFHRPRTERQFRPPLDPASL